jgi:hypothetical protein
LTLQYGSDESKEGEMGGDCNMNVKCDKQIQNIERGNTTKGYFGRFRVARKEYQNTA